MTRFTITLLLLCLLTASHAQKLNTKDFDAEASFLRLPTKGLDPSITSYSVTIQGEDSQLKGLGQPLPAIKESILLNGYNRLEANGGVTVDVFIGTPTSAKPELVTVDKLDKDKKPYKEYLYKQALGVSCTYKIMDNAGRILGENQVNLSEDYKTGTHPSSQAAYKAYNDNFPKAVIDAQAAMLGRAIQSLRNSINIEYGLTPVKEKVALESLSTKDHPDLPRYDKMKTAAIEAFAKMKPDDLNEFKTAIQPVVDFWVAEEKKYDPNNKDERKMNFACRYNLAQLYFWMEDFDNAKAMCTKIEQGDVSSNQGKKMKEEMISLTAHMSKINRPTRHFKLEMSAEDQATKDALAEQREAAYASGDVKLFDHFNEKLGVTPSSFVLPATLFRTNNTSQTGYIVFESNSITPDFRQPKRIRFAFARDREIVAHALDFESVDSLHMEARRFSVQDVKLDAGILSMTLKRALVEHVMPLNKTSLVVVYPTFLHSKLNPDEELTPDIAIWHRERQAYLVADGLTGFRKPMIKIVDGCADAVSFLESKKPGPAVDDPRISAFPDIQPIAEALRLYDGCK